MPAAPIRATCVVVALALPAGATEPLNWSAFYSPRATTPAQSPAPVKPQQERSDLSQCIAAILMAQEVHQIPNNLLLAIGVQEAGRQVEGELTIWPWTANSHGTGVYFRSKAALEAWVRAKQSEGVRSIDVGCMQINQRWHADAFASLEEATEPFSNADYAARFLRHLYDRTGDWWEAAGRYHSSNEEFKTIYLDKLARNHQVATAMMDGAMIQLAAADASSGTAQPNVTDDPMIGWSADMTGAIQGQNVRPVSIYSNAPLRPFLPQNMLED